MKLRALECFCEVGTNGFSFSQAARALCASQPAITRQIQLLENEFGFALFERRGNRVVKMTAAGQAIFIRAQKILAETRELMQAQADLRETDRILTIATTEFNARYTLLPVIKAFRSDRPNIAFSIYSVDPATAAQLVLAGKADLGLCTPTPEMSDDLSIHKCFDVERVLITPRGHPLTHEKRLTLAKIAAHPLILYDMRLSGGRRVFNTFQERGIKVQIALSATTADAIKAYVAENIGVGVIQARAFDRHKDTDIQAIDATRLFPSSPVFAFYRKNATPLHFMRDFISQLMPA